MEKQLIDDIKQILMVSRYKACVAELKRVIEKENLELLEKDAEHQYLSNPVFRSLIDQQTVAIMQKIEEYTLPKPVNYKEGDWITTYKENVP